MNTPLEVMAEIVKRGGPIEAWVWDTVKSATPEVVLGVSLKHTAFPYTCERGIYKFCSLTDPTKKYAPLPTEWTHDWARWRAVDDNGELWEYEEKPHIQSACWSVLGDHLRLISAKHDPSNWENSLQERPRKTRPMNAREFARFVGENLGRYLYRSKMWEEGIWEYCPHIIKDFDPSRILYAENVEGALTWRELPEVEES